MEQRAVIKYNVKLGKTAAETYRLMQQVYKDNCLGRTNVFLWHKRFVDGRVSLEDDKRDGRPTSSRTPEMIEKVRDFVANDHNASLIMMEEALNISRETIRLILHEDLRKTKIGTKLVPHTLTDDQKSLRVNHCKEIVEAVKNDQNFLKTIVTGDETWCFQYDPDNKHQSAEWNSKYSPQAKKTRKISSKITTMLVTFFDCKGIIHKEYIPASQIVNEKYYLEVLKRLIESIRCIRPEYRDSDSWSLLHGNTPRHTSLIVRQFLAQNKVCVLNNPPYSSDLSPCDFFLSPKLKLKLKGCFFDDIETIQMASTRALEAIPQNELEDAFQSLLNRCNQCIKAKGEYFE